MRSTADYKAAVENPRRPRAPYNAEPHSGNDNRSPRSARDGEPRLGQGSTFIFWRIYGFAIIIITPKPCHFKKLFRNDATDASESPTRDRKSNIKCICFAWVIDPKRRYLCGNNFWISSRSRQKSSQCNQIQVRNEGKGAGISGAKAILLPDH